MAEMQDTVTAGPETIKVLITDRIAREGTELHLPRHKSLCSRAGERQHLVPDPDGCTVLRATM